MVTIDCVFSGFLKHKKAHCVVWNIDDNQTRLYLATLNRLSGGDVPERRATLLENLFGAFDNDELPSLLPENAEQIEALRQLSHLELDELAKQDYVENKFQVPVILTFMLEETQAKEVKLALDLMLNTEKEKLSRSQALARLTHFYIERSKPIVEEIP